MIRTGLVALKPGNANGPLCQIALELASQRGLRLTAIAVVDSERVAPAESVPMGASAFKAHRDAVLVEKAREQSRLQLDQFRDRGQAAGLEITTRLAEGTLAATVVHASLGFDLLLVGHTAGTKACDDPKSAKRASPLQELIQGSPRPVLIVPQLAEQAQDVVIAYDESLQAARALYDFTMAGLWQGRTVHVLSLASQAAAAESMSQRAADYLAQHGYSTRPQGHVQGDVAQQILETVNRVGASLLVMGAYGQPQWRQFMFGSVTRTVLSTIRIPVLLST